LTGLAVEEMYIYYAIATVHAVATSRNIRLFIDIPLKAVDRHFELYQVHSLPFFYVGINKFVMIDEPFSYLAVAEDRQFFAMITTHMLSKCDKSMYVVCPSDLVLRAPNEPNCLIALFLGKDNNVLQMCKRFILHSGFDPVWIRSPDFRYWIYSFSAPTRITVQCRDTGSPQPHGTSYQITLDGTGILPNSSSCYIHSETFKLLPHSFGKSVATLARTHIVLPNINNIMNHVEQSLLQPHFQGSTDLHALEDIMERASSRHTTGVEVSRIAQMIQEQQLNSSSLIQAWIFGMIAFMLLVLILILVYSKLYSQPCVFPFSCLLSTRPKPTPVLAPPVSSNPIELQILPDEPAENSEMTREALNGGQQFTQFVRHGTLSADA
jgi:hypothetical protein